MDPSVGLASSAVTWVVAIAGMVFLRWKTNAHGAGLVMAYVVGLWLIHWPGGTLYLLPWYQGWDAELVELGFQQSAYAIVAFGIGSCLIAPYVASVLRARRAAKAFSASKAPATMFARTYLAVGFLCYFVLIPIFGRLPTVSALLSTGWNLVTVGFCLACWNAWDNKSAGHVFRWLAAALLLPLLTVVSAGFIGYGTALTIAIVSFVGGFYRPRWRIVAAGLLLMFLGSSFFVTYMRDRGAIRQVVWSDEAFSARVDQLQQTLSTVEGFDISNDEHLAVIDSRLNQNRLVGEAAYYLDSQMVDFARGDTLWQAVAALVPRVIWQNKTVEAGSGDVVSHFTGVTFAAGTSVGIGHVMEFYINFGTTGVWLGFLVLGIILATVDRMAGERLSQRNWSGFALWYLPGFSLLQVGGSFVELTASAAAAVVVALVLNAAIEQWRTARNPVRSGSHPTGSLVVHDLTRLSR